VLGVTTTARAQDASPALRSSVDSVAALASLDADLRRNPRDAAKWHQKGMIAWSLLRPRRSANMMQRDDIALARNADSSLRLAVANAPDSARYAIDLLRYFLNSGVATMRSQAGAMASRAYDAARRSNDVAALADAKDEMGMVAWRHYEMFANRYAPSNDAPSLTPEVLDHYALDPKGLGSLLNQLTRQGDTFTGEADYRAAEAAFTDAVAADPASKPARGHLYMLLAERGRWDELRRMAQARTASDPSDAMSWLAIGLAEHRLGRADSAGAAFTTGLAKLPDAERARYTRLTRLLPPKSLTGRTLDSTRYVAADTGAQRTVERNYWATNDPLTLTSVNERYNEFLARVVYSELRWSSPDFDLHGADTDRGDIYVRYGPPLVDVGLGPTGQGADQQAWYYARGISFIFRTPPAFGTATLGGDYGSAADQHRMNVPAAFDTDLRGAHPDSVAVQVARFRAGGDSTDLYVAALLPVDSMIQGVNRGHASVDIGFALLTKTAQRALRDSGRTEVEAGDAEFVSTRSWSGRVPSADYTYRVEGRGVASQRAARGSGVVSAARGNGFGTSDVLLASKIDPNPAASGARWTDYTLIPNGGVFQQGAPVALLWETYGLESRDGTSRYTVTVNVTRDDKGGLAGLAARIVGGVAGALGRSATADGGRLSLAFDRQAPARPVTTDYLTLDLASAPTGAYTLKVTVRDAGSGKESTSAAHFSVVPKSASKFAGTE